MSTIVRQLCLLVFSLFLSEVITAPTKDKYIFDDRVCQLIPEFNEKVKQEIKNISTDAQKIIDFVVNGPDKGVTYRELSKFVDKFGPRFTGTEVLENAIDYMLDLLYKEGHDNVHGEIVDIPTWKRGKEWAQITSPRRKAMNILGLGYSVGTNGQTLTGDVLVVKDFDELNRRSNEAKGKFVAYNFDFHSYGQQVQYRSYGASKAAQFGAIGALIRSVTPLSIDSPHTGMMHYNESVPKIPAVSITVEDAELMWRWSQRGEKITVSLYMEATNGNTSTSRNTISEISGTDHPEQVVIVSGHLDSWDVGQGAMDDGGGAFISWRALSVVRKLGLRPKRTMRSILWTGEEMGLIGAQAYAQQHASEMNQISVAMESDIGTFTPLGLTYSGTNPTAQCIVNQVLKVLSSINASRLTLSSEGSDIDVFMDEGVPGSSLDNDNAKYFYFHHSNGDTMTVEDSDQLDLCTALWAVVSYSVASLTDLLPR